jgi:uncharacterized protein
MLIRELSADQCTDILASNRLAFLACVSGAHPYLVPIYYAYSDHRLYSFTMPGKKLEWMRANPSVSVLVFQGHGGGEWASVVVDGTFEELPDRIGHKFDRDHAWSVLSKYVMWWEPGAVRPNAPPPSDHYNHVFYRIGVQQISGREAVDDASC